MSTTEPHPPASGPFTLDAHRIDLLRSFLVSEAAADLARSHVRHYRLGSASVRRLAVGGLALALLVSAMVAFDARSASKTHRADAAVSINDQDGWITISLTDPYADADEVAAELRAAGIPARVAPDQTEPRPDHDAEWAAAHPEAYSSRTATEAGEDWQRGEDIPPNTITWIDILVADPHHPPAGETGPSPDGTNEDHTAILLPPGQGQDVVLFVSK